jgi:hypothetical protein
MAICIIALIREASKGCPSAAPPEASKAALLQSITMLFESSSDTCPLVNFFDNAASLSGRISFFTGQIDDGEK